MWHDAAHSALLALPETGTLVGLRTDLVEAFVSYLQTEGIDRFAAAGIAASWWEDNIFDLQAAASRGWNAVLEGWLTTTEATEDDKNAPDLADQTPIRLLASGALDQRRELAAEAARLDAEIKAAEPSDDEDDEDAGLEDVIRPDELKKLKAARTKTKKDLKTIDAGLLSTARSTLSGMNADAATEVVIGELRSRIERLLGDHHAGAERQVIAWHADLADKYGTTLRELELARNEAAARLNKHLMELGYD